MAPNPTNQMVRRFHLAFNVPVNNVPTVPPPDVRLLRVRLIAEELAELAEASGVVFTFSIGEHVFNDVDMVEVADAIGDLDYVVQGSNIVYGLPAEYILAEIHNSNMSKLGEDGKPIYREDGKVVKGPNYFKPTPGIQQILWQHSSGPLPGVRD